MEDIESIRRMTPAQKFQPWLALCEFAEQLWNVPDAETGRCKWEAWEREHELSNIALCRGLMGLDH